MLCGEIVPSRRGPAWREGWPRAGVRASTEREAYQRAASRTFCTAGRRRPIRIWIGPLLIEVFTNASKDQRIGFSPVLILLGVGLALMFTLKKTTGAKGQIEPASPPAA